MSEDSSEKNSTSLRPTDVVTCFLVRKDTSEARLLLVKRSQGVGSYQGHWAGVSGFVEAGVTPEEQAFTEIREETSLQKDQVLLLKRGQVVEHIDQSLGRRWLIHPFLFEVRQPESITLDWEAKELRWISPDELTSYATVPKLYEAFLAASQGDDAF